MRFFGSRFHMADIQVESLLDARKEPGKEVYKPEGCERFSRFCRTSDHDLEGPVGIVQVAVELGGCAAKRGPQRHGTPVDLSV